MFFNGTGETLISMHKRWLSTRDDVITKEEVDLWVSGVSVEHSYGALLKNGMDFAPQSAIFSWGHSPVITDLQVYCKSCVHNKLVSKMLTCH